MFGAKESKEEKKERKAKEILAKYGLENISDPKTLESVKSVNLSLAGNAFGELGLALTGVKMEEQIKMSYLSALTEQNWIMIRQLDEISKKLDRK